MEKGDGTGIDKGISKLEYTEKLQSRGERAENRTNLGEGVLSDG